MFTVEWLDVATDELAELWMAAPREYRTPISVAANRLDVELSASADVFGESRSRRRRIAFEMPLGITFDVDPTTRTATVNHVWFCPPRG